MLLGFFIPPLSIISGQKTGRILNLENLKKNPGGGFVEDATLALDGIARQFFIFVQAADLKSR
jgi:hypothetical protein